VGRSTKMAGSWLNWGLTTRVAAYASTTLHITHECAYHGIAVWFHDAWSTTKTISAHVQFRGFIRTFYVIVAKCLPRWDLVVRKECAGCGRF
jgi:hypothetical protein